MPNPIVNPKLLPGSALVGGGSMRSALGRLGLFSSFFLGSVPVEPVYSGIKDSTVTPALQTGQNCFSGPLVTHYNVVGGRTYGAYAAPANKCD